jgi:hypothetical protein
MTDETTTVSARELAELLGLTDRRVRQLAAENILPRAERGRYPRGPALRAYLDHRILGPGSPADRACPRAAEYARGRIAHLTELLRD